MKSLFFFCRFLHLPPSHCASLTVMMGRSDDERDELIAALSKKDQPSMTLESSSLVGTKSYGSEEIRRPCTSTGSV